MVSLSFYSILEKGVICFIYFVVVVVLFTPILFICMNRIPTTFWITNPQTYVRDNVAAGSEVMTVTPPPPHQKNQKKILKEN